MATLLEKFNKSDYKDAINTGADKTPISKGTGNSLEANVDLDVVRGKMNTKKYTDTLTGDL